MQLPVFSRSIMDPSVPPMYTWPRSIKRALLFFAVIGVIAAYLLLGGGIIAFLAILAEWAG